MRPNEYDNFLVNIRCSDEFRERMEKCLSTEAGEAASGEKNIKIVNSPRKFRAGSIAAMVAAVVIVFGAVLEVNRFLSGSGVGSYLPGEKAYVTDEADTTDTEAADDEKLIVTEMVIGNEPEFSDAETDEKICRLLTDFSVFIYDGGTVECYGHKGKAEYQDYGMDNNSVDRTYTITDPDELIKEITALSWKLCSGDQYERGIASNFEERIYDQLYNLYYGSEDNCCVLSENGYMSWNSNYFKLEDEAEIRKLNDILAEVLVLTPESELAEKVHNGISDYNGEFSWEQSNWNDEISVSDIASGNLIYSAADNLMYMTGKGGTVLPDDSHQDIYSFELIMNSENGTACRAFNDETGETDDAWFDSWQSSIERPGSIPDFHYVYLYRMVEASLCGPAIGASAMVQIDDEGISSQQIEDGITEYNWTGTTFFNRTDISETRQYTLQITDKGQIVYFRIKGEEFYESFTFEKDRYESDSDSFEMDTEEIKTKYESIKAAYLERWNVTEKSDS